VAWFRDPQGALYRPGRRSVGSGKEERRPMVGARPAAIDGAVSSGGGNGGRGNGRGGERMGWQRRFGWSAGAREVSRWPEVSRAAVLRPVAGGASVA
jgi:hypothetical protein